MQNPSIFQGLLRLSFAFQGIKVMKNVDLNDTILNSIYEMLD